MDVGGQRRDGSAVVDSCGGAFDVGGNSNESLSRRRLLRRTRHAGANPVGKRQWVRRKRGTCLQPSHLGE